MVEIEDLSFSKIDILDFYYFRKFENGKMVEYQYKSAVAYE